MASARIELAIALPQTFPDGPVDLALVRRVLDRAEALGLHSVWVQEQVIGPTPSLEPVEMLTWAAAFSSSVRLGVAVLLTTMRGPVHLAKSLATLDHLSGGRLIAGVGLGGNVPIYPAYGIEAEHRVTRFVEGLEIMRRLWTEPRVTFEGRFWKLEDAAMEPKPVQRPHPPLWFGAHHRTAIERAAVMGDGFIGAGAASAAHFAEHIRILDGALAGAGRDRASFPVAKRVYIAVDDDEARARKRLEVWFGRFYGDAALAARCAVWGAPARCAEGVAAIVAAGARLLILNPVFDEGEQLERLVAEVAPGLGR